jgi:hypothetical protein
MAMFVRLTCLIRRRHRYRLRGLDGRVFMECAECGHRTQGWEMGPKAKPISDGASASFRLWLDDTELLPSSEEVDETPESLRALLVRPDELRLQLDL